LKFKELIQGPVLYLDYNYRYHIILHFS